MARTGRPPKDVKKGKVVSVRMLPEEFERVKAYADKADKTVTEVMMEGVNLLMESKKK